MQLPNFHSFKRYALFPIGLFCLLFTGILSDLEAQKRSFGTLPLMETGKKITPSEHTLNDTEDYKHLVSIYDRLVEARGDLRYRVPELFLKDEEGNAAYVDYGSLNITIEKKAYETTKALGDEAVAYLLSHELTHYYEKHAWKNQFARENADLKVGTTLGKIDDDIIYETEADYLGGFLSYTAGYGLFDKGEQVINALYDAYQMPNEMPNYPTRAERIELYKRSTAKLTDLIDAFDMANYMLAIGRYDDAYKFYDYVLKYYQSRELYNNLGVAATLGAMELYTSKDLTFKYVTQLEVRFKGSRNVASTKERIEKLLHQSIQHFNTAIALDPDYASAYLNRANAYALLKDWKKASFYLLEEALPIAQKDPKKHAKTLIDIDILHGIILANQGDNDSAKEKFESATDKGSRLAKENLDILLGKQTAASISRSLSFDQFKSINMDDFFTKLIVDEKKIVKLSDNFTFFQSLPNDQYKVYFTLAEGKDKRLGTAIIFNQDNIAYKTNKNIGIGDSGDDILRAYGVPNYTLETSIGQYWIYDHKIFVIEKDTLKRFINYDTRDI